MERGARVNPAYLRDRVQIAPTHDAESYSLRMLHYGQLSDRLHVTTPELSMASSSKRRPAPKRLSSREKVRAHRKRLRARGLRPIQIWVPDTRTASFKAEAHRQSQVVARSPYARRDQDFIDAISMQLGE
jgi:hypothetical protein